MRRMDDYDKVSKATGKDGIGKIKIGRRKWKGKEGTRNKG